VARDKKQRRRESARNGSQGGEAVTLEERLHDIRDGLMLTGDLLELLALAPDCMRGDLPSVAACRGAAAHSRLGGQQLRELLDTLPPSVLNWTKPTNP
jgi:hypothetical protein